jgi:parallel beta-helix repeat protein
VAIPAGAAIQPVVDASPVGTTFVLDAGTYREQQVTPRPGDVFQGAGEGTVLNGARLLDGWVADAEGWSVGGQAQGGFVHGECRPEAPRCSYPEELFVDGTRLQHVASLAEVGPETWFFDYDADRIHIGTDPTAKTVETSTTPFAFRSDARGVVIRDLVVTHYASQSQYGAIHVEGPDWTIERVTSKDNHATGFFLEGDRAVVRDSRSIGNGQLGLGATLSADSRVERVELADNNQDGFDDEWEGGGAKFTDTDGLLVADSYVHDNDGAGIWLDIDARNTAITNNRSIDNSGAGIYVEISQKATITGNTVTGNGFGEVPMGWVWGAGIQIAASSEVTVTGNQVSGNHNALSIIQQDRGSGPNGEYLVDDVSVTGNTIVLGDGLLGVATDVPGDAVFDRKIEFEDNTYDVPSETRAFVWKDADDGLDLAGWNALGFS